MSLFKKNSLAIALVGALVGVAALQGCSSDEQASPGASGSGGSHAGTGGKSNAGSAGKPINEGGSAGEETPGEGGMGGTSAGGEGGEGGAAPACDLSFNNGTLSAITENGGELPPLP
ncbi:MAG: hypothetical protein WDO69_28415 [Pseudomonadota bacterium]